MLCLLLVHFLCVLHEFLDQILGRLIRLLLRLVNPTNRIRHSTTPHDLIGFGVDNVGHDASLSVIVSPNIRSKAITPSLTKGNAVTPTETPTESESRTNARAFNLRFLF